jgi:chromosome segregation ATPase
LKANVGGKRRMLTWMYNELRYKYQNEIIENENMKKHIQNLDKEIERLNGENRYLLQRLKEMRHKSWFPVYAENLELQEQNKNLDETCQELIEEYAKLEKEFNQYKGVVKSIEIFIGRFADEKR